jgi:hypothetical protein
MVDSSLLPVVVGGLIAMGGVLISGGITLAVNFAQFRNEQKKRRGEKFEELVTTLFDYEHWLDVARDMYLYTSAEAIVPTLPPSPFAKLHAISAVHFPEFESKIRELEQAGRTYWVWIVAARKKIITGEQNYIAGYEDAYKAFYQVLRALRTDLTNYARRELAK